MTKRLMLGLALLAVVVFGLGACGGSGGGSSPGSNYVEVIGEESPSILIITPQEAEVETDSLGNDIAVNQLLIRMLEQHYTLEDIAVVIQPYNGQVIGQIPGAYIYQVQVDSSSLVELDTIIGEIEQHSYVSYVLENTLMKNSELSDGNPWKDQPQDEWQRGSNQIEQATELYRATRGNIYYSRKKVSIGITEPSQKVYFNTPDLTEFRQQALYEGIRINADERTTYAQDDDEKRGNQLHATHVLGIMAAKIDDDGMGGLLASLGNSQEIFDIHVAKSDSAEGVEWWWAEKLASIYQLIENGITIFNFSFGSYLAGTQDIIGQDVGSLYDHSTFSTNQFNRSITAYNDLFQQNLDVLFVIGAGNHRTILTGNNFTPQSAGVGRENVIIVGGHFNEYDVSNEASSFLDNSWNIGETIDISASYFYDGILGDKIRGTSFSSPLVTATAAMMKSIDDSLTPSDIKTILRESALPLEPYFSSIYQYNSKRLTSSEVGNDPIRLGKSARLNAKGALQAVIKQQHPYTYTGEELTCLDARDHLYEYNLFQAYSLALNYPSHPACRGVLAYLSVAEGQAVLPVNYSQAISYAEGADDPLARTVLGYLYNNELYFDSSAAQYLQDSAQAGERISVNMLAEFAPPSVTDPTHIKNWLPYHKASSDLSWPLATSHLGHLYTRPEFEDFHKAYELFMIAQEKGESFAQYWLGEMYEYGNGVTQDIATARYWYQLSANQLNPYAVAALQRLDNNDNAVDTVTSPTGRVWMDRNLGATRVATAYNDSAAYGDLYQWGRGTDGHEKRTSPTTTTFSSSDTPGHGSFILNLTSSSSPYDWRNPQNDNLWQGVSGVNNPCPSGFRLPMSAEWEAERVTWASNERVGAFASPLNLVSAGGRYFDDGAVFSAGSSGFYWSSSVVGSGVRYLYLGSDIADTNSFDRAFGFSVRCLED